MKTQTPDREFFLPPDKGKGWELGAESFTRQEVFNLLHTQRAMISNDFKKHFGDIMTDEMFSLFNLPRIPKF